MAQQAKRLLHVIVAAFKPLTLQEMNVALAIDERLEEGERCQSFDDLDITSTERFRDKIRGLCGLFVSVIDSRVYLIHLTAKEFLVARTDVGQVNQPDGLTSSIWKHSLMPIDSNFVLARICIFCLCFRKPDASDCLADTQEWSDRISADVPNGPLQDLPDYHQRNTLIGYAAEHWVGHLSSTRIKNDVSTLRAVEQLCDPESNRCIAWLNLRRETYYNDTSPLRLRKGQLPHTNLTLVSSLGLCELVEYLLHKDDKAINSQNSRGRTALWEAAKTGKAKVVRLPLKINDIQINLSDKNGVTPLSIAAGQGFDEVVKLLLREEHCAFQSCMGRSQTGQASTQGEQRGFKEPK